MNSDNNNCPCKKYKHQLLNKINEIRNEIRHRQERLNYNIYAGVCKNAIIAQRKEIFYLQLQLESLEYKFQHNLP